MRKKYFYSHLINLDTLISDLDSLDLKSEEKKELLDIAHMHVHQTIMDSILSELTDVDKKRFLELVLHGEDEKVWGHLNEKVEKIEEKIISASEQIKGELKEDIKKVKS
ncbi:MAG: hypothetical protein NUV69_02080 [Candidatus Curtissbacteria bacterium]|nr:hypothetical protein [Candidatus Curtissbacteria bacterium]